MDFASIIAIIITSVVIYFFVKLVVSPLVKTILGLIAFFGFIYIAQNVFNLDIGAVFGPYGKYLHIENWINFQGIINKIKTIWH